jgi:ketol-acid reductoisomerase
MTSVISEAKKEEEREGEEARRRIWYDKDVSYGQFRNETVAVVGYGIQGRAQALNMMDSGQKVVVALRKEGRSWKQAQQEGCRVMDIGDAVAAADVIHVLIPDMAQRKVYNEFIAPNLSAGKALAFSHGAAIHWKWIVPPKDVDVFLVAPKAPGQRLRELYGENFGTPALVAVHRDYTNRGWERALGLAKAVGCTRAGVLETTFKEEVESDWFGEQADLCGGVDRLVRTSFEVLVENGYNDEVAYFEVLHELKLIVDLIQRYGIAGMYNRVSETARYGGLTRGDKVVNDSSKEAMKQLLRDIQSGRFEREWVEQYEKLGAESFERYMRELREHPIEKTGKKMRAMIWPGSVE